MSEDVTFDEYRTGYIAEKHNVTDNCARALQLFELGFSANGTAKRLGLAESTVKSYRRELMDKIHPDVVFTLTPDCTRFDVWGDRDVANYDEYGYDEGVADARASEAPATDRASQIDPDMRERERPLNRGMALEEIPTELITLPNVE